MAMRSVMTAVWVVVLAMGGCRSGDGGARRQQPTQRPATRPDAAAPTARGGTCTADSNCDFGLVCTSGHCGDSECHDGAPMNPPRACTGNLVCRFDDVTARRNGRGRCAPSDAQTVDTDAGDAADAAPVPNAPRPRAGR